MATKEPIKEMVVERTLSACPGNHGKNSLVLSCGGIYIPHRGNSSRFFHQILNIQSKEETAKIVDNCHTQNALHEVLFKESLN